MLSIFLADEDIIEKIIYCWISVCPCSKGKEATTSQIPLAHQLQEWNFLPLADGSRWSGSLSPCQADIPVSAFPRAAQTIMLWKRQAKELISYNYADFHQMI